MTSRNRLPDHEASIGRMMRRARLQKGMSMETLADQIGVKWQQIQKYENGKNRVAVSTLLHVASVLGVSPGSIVPGLDDKTDALSLTAPEQAMVRAIRAWGVEPSHIMRVILDIAEGIQARGKPKGGRGASGGATTRAA